MGEDTSVSEMPAGSGPNTGDSSESAWERIRRRLEASRSALERRFEPSAEEKSKILKDRAMELAREPREDAEAQLEVVEFLLAHEKYGIEPHHIREIFSLKTLTPIPCTPPFVLGVTNLRGEVLSVIDLKRFFDLPDEGLTDFTKVIVLRSDTMEFGILADSVLGARSIPLDEVQPALPTLTGIREEYLRGVTQERLAILDAERILCDDRIAVHEEIEA